MFSISFLSYIGWVTFLLDITDGYTWARRAVVLMLSLHLLKLSYEAWIPPAADFPGLWASIEETYPSLLEHSIEGIRAEVELSVPLDELHTLITMVEDATLEQKRGVLMLLHDIKHTVADLKVAVDEYHAEIDICSYRVLHAHDHALITLQDAKRSRPLLQRILSFKEPDMLGCLMAENNPEIFRYYGPNPLDSMWISLIRNNSDSEAKTDSPFHKVHIQQGVLTAHLLAGRKVLRAATGRLGELWSKKIFSATTMSTDDQVRKIDEGMGMLRKLWMHFKEEVEELKKKRLSSSTKPIVDANNGLVVP
ncbi:hypothetical protein BDY19DRAFT_904594 [Irpex rosettiformis]|uniref:Uncharacterized protein n=1 Tax=Irpex rosettiformis TaxID=378272 RepID=A0ACB8UA39_9APHY|nr:hypothetical protein BDY19DRAFT_904594 [Irpex rosettiformis]